MAGDVNEVSDVFRHDLALCSTERLTNAEHASAHPGIDAAGVDVVYDQEAASGRREIQATSLLDPSLDSALSLVDDPLGVSLDNHHPAISADGRFVAYLEEYLSQAETMCQVHIYDRRTEVYHRQPCPEALAAARETARPMFTPTADQVLWHLPSTAKPIQLANPLYEDWW